MLEAGYTNAGHASGRAAGGTGCQAGLSVGQQALRAGLTQATGSAAGDALPPRAFRLARDPDPPPNSSLGRSRGAAAPSPPSRACHLPPGRACGDCLAAFGRAGRVSGPAPAATAPPRDTGRASAAEQEGSVPRRRGASRLAFLPSGSLCSEPPPCSPQARSRPRPSFLRARSSPAAALLVSGLLSGRRPFLKLVLRPFPPPPSSLQVLKQLPGTYESTNGSRPI